MVIDGDGKIVVGGFTTMNGNFENRNFALARYNTDGSLDTTFGGDGKVTTDWGDTSNDIINSIAIDNDGKIVVGGNTNLGAGIARYNTDGSLDTTFDGDGKVNINWISTGNNGINSIAIANDGKIVVGGFVANSFMNAMAINHRDFALARYNTDGSLDTTFDEDGKVTTNWGISGNDRINSIKIDANGKIVVAGMTSSGSGIARYNTNGSLDTTFDGDGKAIQAIGTYNYIRSIAIDANGKIVAGGVEINGVNSSFLLARYNSDGSLDK